MKHFLVAALAAFSSSVYAQDIAQSEVPSLVLNTFQSKFTNTTDVEWEKEGELYKVDFEIGRLDHDLWIDKSGTIKKHKEELRAADLPAAVSQKIKNDFKDYSIDDVERVEADGKVLFYVELDSRSGDREVVFTEDGTLQ